jgi:Holliday junction resolvase
MVNKQKQKGTRWENDLVDLLEKDLGGTWRRIPSSGALGTVLGESKLTGDVTGKLGYIKPLKIECKVGYGGAKQLTVQKEWLDKVSQEAILDNSLPVLAAKFLGARTGTKYFFTLDYNTFVYIMKQLEQQAEELKKLYENVS